MSDPNVPSVWKPSPFEGKDLLPAILPAGGDDEPLVGRDNVSSKDLILPALSLLQGMSPAVTEGQIEGAKPGAIMHTGTQEVLKPPVRVLFVHHSRSNALLPDPSKPEYAGLEKCIARDGAHGDRYGDCETCRKCLDFGPNGEKPLGSQSHNFVAMTSLGPAVLRFSRTSFKAARQFLTTWMMGRKNLWAHPVVVKVKAQQRTLPNGQKANYFTWEPLWQQSELVPPELKLAALELHNEVQAAYEAGRFTPPEGDAHDDE